MLFKPSDPWPHSHYDVIDYHHKHYEKAIASGASQPFLYPWGLLGPLGVIIYLLIPNEQRPWLKKCRYLAFAWITSFAIYTTAYTRARELVSALVLGLLSAWSVIWFGAILVCNDAQTDFMRIERTTGVFRSNSRPQEERTEGNGKTESKEEGTGDDAAKDDVANGHAGPRDRHGEFAWQPYPLTPFIERLDWVLDLLCSFRGVGWNFRNSNISPPPKYIQEQLRANSGPMTPKHSYKTYPGQMKLYTSRQELLKDNAWKVFKGYMILDALKTAMMYDPYFWGQIDRVPPSSYLPQNPVFRNVYHLALTMLGIQYALQSVFALGPLIFCGILTPSLLGARAEIWSHPSTWGSYSAVLEQGLAGWWGNWWHQTFRFAFSEPSRKIIEVSGMNKKSPAAKALQLFIAFFLSGVIHASGVYTCAGPTRPITGSMAFFLLQAVGIFAETTLTKVAKSVGLAHKMPAWVNKCWTFLYVHVWFYYTAHLLCDDFARGGVWLFEPVPISLLRGMGLGADERDGWWCWNLRRFVRWYSGDTWWNSGLAL